MAPWPSAHPPDPLLFKIIFKPFVLLKITEWNTRILNRIKKIKYATKDYLKGTKKRICSFQT